MARHAIDPAVTSAWADSALAALREARARDHSATVEVTGTLIRYFTNAGDSCRSSETYGLRSASLTEVGQLDSALFAAQRALDLFPPGCDSTVLMRGYLGLSRLHIELKEFEKVVVACDRALVLWNPAWQAQKIYFSLLTNRAIAKANLGDMDGAQKSFRTILVTALAQNSPQDVDDAIANISVIKNMLGEPDSAEYYCRVGLRNARTNKQDGRIAIGYSNLSYLMTRRKEYRRAIELADSGLTYAVAASDLKMQGLLEDRLALNHARLGDYQQAYAHAQKYHELSDSLLNTEKVHSLAEMQEKYESEKKARENLRHFGRTSSKGNWNVRVSNARATSTSSRASAWCCVAGGALEPIKVHASLARGDPEGKGRERRPAAEHPAGGGGRGTEGKRLRGRAAVRPAPRSSSPTSRASPS